MVSTTNVDGTNPGPNVVSQPDTVQYPIGNVWKIGVFQISITPTAVSADTAPIQNFASTGIGLLVNDSVDVGYGSGLTPTANVAIATGYVSAADQLSIQFVNPTAGSLTPAAGNYQVTVFRPLPLWKSGGSLQMDW
jgi:hypothetical protein